MSYRGEITIGGGAEPPVCDNPPSISYKEIQTTVRRILRLLAPSILEKRPDLVDDLIQALALKLWQWPEPVSSAKGLAYRAAYFLALHLRRRVFTQEAKIFVQAGDAGWSSYLQTLASEDSPQRLERLILVAQMGRDVHKRFGIDGLKVFVGVLQGKSVRDIERDTDMSKSKVAELRAQILNYLNERYSPDPDDGGRGPPGWFWLMAFWRVARGPEHWNFNPKEQMNVRTKKSRFDIPDRKRMDEYPLARSISSDGEQPRGAARTAMGAAGLKTNPGTGDIPKSGGGSPESPGKGDGEDAVVHRATGRRWRRSSQGRHRSSRRAALLRELMPLIRELPGFRDETEECGHVVPVQSPRSLKEILEILEDRDPPPDAQARPTAVNRR